MTVALLFCDALLTEIRGFRRLTNETYLFFFSNIRRRFPYRIAGATLAAVNLGILR